MRFSKIALIVGSIAVIGLAISACRQEEQNRPLSYNKGVYGGKQVQKLSKEQVRELEFRIRNQGSL